MSMLSKRMSLIKPSSTLNLTKKVTELKKKGKNIISLGAGESMFQVQNNIKEAVIKGLNNTKYTEVEGMLELRQAIANKLQRENNINYQTNEIIVSNGAKQVIYNLFMASLNENDEVIIPAPYWVSYPDIVTLASGKPKFIKCEIEDNFKLKADKLQKAISSKTKWLIINSPCNPSGAVYSTIELENIANILRKEKHVQILCDDIYEHIIFDNKKFANLAEIAPDLKPRIFIANGISKSHALAGWRIGWGAGCAELIAAMSALQSQSTSNACSIAQIAAIEALNGKNDYVKRNLIFEEHRNIAYSILSNIKGLRCYFPEGAFYMFINCKDLLSMNKESKSVIKINNCTELAEYILNESLVAVVPGVSFGLENYFRISFSVNNEELQIACKKIAEACEKLI